MIATDTERAELSRMLAGGKDEAWICSQYLRCRSRGLFKVSCEGEDGWVGVAGEYLMRLGDSGEGALMSRACQEASK